MVLPDSPIVYAHLIFKIEFIAKNVALAESLIDYGTLEHRMFALDQTASGPKSPEDCQQLFLGGLISQVGDQLRRIEEDRYQYVPQSSFSGAYKVILDFTTRDSLH